MPYFEEQPCPRAKRLKRNDQSVASIQDKDQGKTLSRSSGISRWSPILQGLLIVTGGLWIFWPTLRADWLIDDKFYIPDNPLLRDPARLWKAWFQPGSFIEYYPLQETVQWLQWWLFGANTLGYHLTNVALHILNAFLVWKLFSKFGLRFAWLGGLLFAIHPAQVESVTLIAELKNTLSLPPFLLAMCAWIDYEDHKQQRDYWLALGLFLVAMLCKITMSPFPVIILLFAWWKRSRIDRNDVKGSVPFFVVSLVLGIITIEAGNTFAQANNFPPYIEQMGGLFSRLVLAGVIFSFYFSKFFWPGVMLPIYPKWAIDPSALSQILPLLAWLVATYWLWAKRQNWGRHVILGVGFFLITLAPFLGFHAISYMRNSWVQDHLLYIPIIGLIGISMAGLERINESLSDSLHFLFVGGVALVVVILTFESHYYAGEFVDEDTLWTYTVQRNPTAWGAYYALGDLALKDGQVAQAIQYYEIALKIRPNTAEVHNAMGVALLKSGQVSEAIEEHKKAVEIYDGLAAAHYNLGKALHTAGRTSEAIEEFKRTLQINPDDANAYNNLGNCLQETGRLQPALESLTQALRINPNLPEAHNNLGVTLAKLGRMIEAEDEFEAALQIDPANSEARINLAHLKRLQTSAPVEK